MFTLTRCLVIDGRRRAATVAAADERAHRKEIHIHTYIHTSLPRIYLLLYYLYCKNAGVVLTTLFIYVYVRIKENCESKIFCARNVVDFK